jgi:hypothetical protein
MSQERNRTTLDSRSGGVAVWRVETTRVRTESLAAIRRQPARWAPVASAPGTSWPWLGRPATRAPAPDSTRGGGVDVGTMVRTGPDGAGCGPQAGSGTFRAAPKAGPRPREQLHPDHVPYDGRHVRQHGVDVRFADGSDGRRLPCRRTAFAQVRQRLQAVEYRRRDQLFGDGPPEHSADAPDCSIDAVPAQRGVNHRLPDRLEFLRRELDCSQPAVQFGCMPQRVADRLHFAGLPAIFHVHVVPAAVFRACPLECRAYFGGEDRRAMMQPFVSGSAVRFHGKWTGNGQ